MYKNVIFDVDGTLLETLEDIRLAINHALLDCGYNKQYNFAEARGLVGSGAYVLVERAIAYQSKDKIEVDRVYKTLLPYYKQYQGQHTKPFPGIVDLLHELKKNDISCYVLTNKPDPLTQIIVKQFFNGIMSDVCGAKEGLPIKPSKEFTESFLSKNHLKKEETLFVGDSEVDIRTGINATLDVALVLWGYGNYSNMNLHDATYLAHDTKELLSFILNKK